jgi:threonine aldolase
MIAGLLAGAGVVDPDAVETNIVMLELTAVRIDARQLVEAARAEGVLAAAVGPQTVRLITHLDVTTDDCRKAAETLARLLDA